MESALSTTNTTNAALNLASGARRPGSKSYRERYYVVREKFFTTKEVLAVELKWQEQKELVALLSNVEGEIRLIKRERKY